LRDAWFPVAHTPTLRVLPLRRTVHSQPYHLWRDGDRIRATDYYPGQRRAVPNSELAGPVGDYPVIDRYGHIWVWYGDPRHADPALLPEIPFLPLKKAQPRSAWGVNFMHCTYELVLENILDLTHTDFVHAAYAGETEAFDDDRISFESTSETVTMIRTVKKRPTSRYQRDVLGIIDRYQDQTAYTHVFIRSGVCFLHTHYSSAPSIPLMQSNTPESRLMTRANYVFGIQQTTDKRFAREWPKTATIIGQQDEAVLNPQNPRYVLQPPQPDRSTRFDAAGLHFRDRFLDLAARQLDGDTSYLADAADGSRVADVLKINRQN
jgi:phenylpropionate dioxygenase-like ring-hydroxylating dioxygenase large terminal subunit